MVVQNVWKQVIQRCGLEDYNTAKRLFENLKKRFNKRRKAVKVVQDSGTSSSAVAAGKLKLALVFNVVRTIRSVTGYKDKRSWVDIPFVVSGIKMGADQMTSYEAMLMEGNRMKLVMIGKHTLAWRIIIQLV